MEFHGNFANVIDEFRREYNKPAVRRENRLYPRGNRISHCNRVLPKKAFFQFVLYIKIYGIISLDYFLRQKNLINR